MVKRTMGVATSNTRTYRVWAGMRQRCNDPNHPKYAIYGGRGIAVCERWQRYEYFLADMGEAPMGYSIGRLDNDKGYAPDNCAWQSAVEQNRNRRNVRMITFSDETLPLSVWASRIGISTSTLSRRLAAGYSVSDAMTSSRVKPSSSGLKGIYRYGDRWRVQITAARDDGQRKHVGLFNSLEQAQQAYEEAIRRNV